MKHNYPSNNNTMGGAEDIMRIRQEALAALAEGDRAVKTAERLSKEYRTKAHGFREDVRRRRSEMDRR